SVPLSTRFGPAELGYCLADADIRLLVTDPTTEDRAGRALADQRTAVERPYDVAELGRIAEEQSDGALAHRPAESDASVMLYTSGTTGKPKGVPRTHRAEHTAAVAHL